MGTLLRLDTISPSLAAAYREADDARRRHVALDASLAAVSQAGLQGADIDAALAILRHGATDALPMYAKLHRLAAQLDEEYFELSEAAETTTPAALVIFRQARAAAALAFALTPGAENLHEALCEAIAASENRAEAVRGAEMALSAR